MVQNMIGHAQSTANQRFNILAAAPLAFPTVTTARLIGDLYATPASVTTTTSGIQILEMGVAVVTEPAFDAGVVSLPDPRVAADSPARGWLWRGVMMMSYQNPGGAEIQISWACGFRGSEHAESGPGNPHVYRK